jgi:hypothetical protein
MNRYLENVLYQIVVGNLKIQNSPTAYINSDELVCQGPWNGEGGRGRHASHFFGG